MSNKHTMDVLYSEYNKRKAIQKDEEEEEEDVDDDSDQFVKVTGKEQFLQAMYDELKVHVQRLESKLNDENDTHKETEKMLQKDLARERGFVDELVKKEADYSA